MITYFVSQIVTYHHSRHLKKSVIVMFLWMSKGADVLYPVENEVEILGKNVAFESKRKVSFEIRRASGRMGYRLHITGSDSARRGSALL